MMLGALACRAQAHGENVTGRLRRAAAVASLASGLAVLVVPADPAVATGSQRSLYKTDRIMPYTSNECIGLKKHECITIRSKHTPVGINRFERIALTCPTRFPHVVGWDAKHTEHVSLTLISDRPAPRSHARSQAPIGTLEVAALNNADWMFMLRQKPESVLALEKNSRLALSEGMRGELLPKGISVSVLCPSFFKTRLLESFQGTSDAPMKHMAAKLMEKSPIDAADVARYTVEQAERGRFLLLPHKDTRIRWWLKRWMPGVYFRQVMKYVAANARRSRAGG